MRVHNLSQRKLAALAQISQAYVSLLLNGKRGARPETAWRIAGALKVRTDELFAAPPGCPPPRTTVRSPGRRPPSLVPRRPRNIPSPQINSALITAA
ncbi:helix-turn-helix domain-containing protein [Streptomyces yunnanensis]